MTKVLLLKNKDVEYINPYNWVIIDYPKILGESDWETFCIHAQQLKDLANTLK
jgi:hypothetical protein